MSIDNLPGNLIYTILQSLEPEDLLSLYITNKFNIYLDNDDFLKFLYQRYHIKSNTFISWMKKYNESLLFFDSKLYMYQMENEMDYTPNNLDADLRKIVIDKLRLFSSFIKARFEQFGLAVTLLDQYYRKKMNDDLLCVAISCLKLTFNVLNEYPEEDEIYIAILNEHPELYDMLNKFDIETFTETTKDVFLTLNGKLIVPSSILYTQKNEKVRLLCQISYYNKDIMIYKPSMIISTIIYLLYGEYKIYSLSEISPICKLLVNTIYELINSSFMIATKTKEIIHDIKFQGINEHTVYILDNVEINKPWHIGEYKTITKIGEGTYANVNMIKRVECGNTYAVKKVEYFNVASLEIACLNQLHHDYIINLCDFEINKKTILFLPYFKTNLKKLLNSHDIKPIYFQQLVKAVYHCHINDIIHRDIKPENIVYDETQDVLKLIDFGLSVPYASSCNYLRPEFACTFYYRSPEALLGDSHYNKKIDIWALGLVFHMMLNKGQLLYRADSEIALLLKIFQLFGTPNEQTCYIIA